MEELVRAIGLSGAFSVETFLAVAVSLVVSFVIFYMIRRIPFITSTVLPGLNFTRETAKMTTKFSKDKTLVVGQYQLIAAMVLAYAIRGAASIIVIGWIFATMMSAIAPLFNL